MEGTRREGPHTCTFSNTASVVRRSLLSFPTSRCSCDARAAIPRDEVCALAVPARGVWKPGNTRRAWAKEATSDLRSANSACNGHVTAM